MSSPSIWQVLHQTLSSSLPTPIRPSEKVGLMECACRNKHSGANEQIREKMKKGGDGWCEGEERDSSSYNHTSFGCRTRKQLTTLLRPTVDKRTALPSLRGWGGGGTLISHSADLSAGARRWPRQRACSRKISGSVDGTITSLRHRRQKRKQNKTNNNKEIMEMESCTGFSSSFSTLSLLPFF